MTCECLAKDRNRPVCFEFTGILFWTTTLICGTESLRGSAVILQAKTKLAEAKAAEANVSVLLCDTGENLKK